MIKNLLLCTVLTLTVTVNAQEIVLATGSTEKAGINLQEVRSIDAKTYSTTKVILKNTDKLSTTKNSTNYKSSPQRYVAAISMDSNNNLFYVPMKRAEVHTINSSQKKATIQTFLSKVQSCDENSLYTRMTTGYDGNVYAINNGGTEVLRINTSNNTIQNLGGIPALETILNSFTDEKEKLGGDMVADAFGNVYIITALKKVIKVNIANQTAEFLGEIKGLPSSYMVNAAAVKEDGTVLLGTTTMQGFYTLDINSLEAKFTANYDAPIYDMYSKYFLRQNDADQIAKAKESYNVYPTIVKNKVINVTSKTKEIQDLTIGIYDISGNLIMTKKSTNKANTKIELNKRMTPGFYLIKAVNQNGVEVINTKFTLVK